jgi:hypothetical protein
VALMISDKKDEQNAMQLRPNSSNTDWFKKITRFTTNKFYLQKPIQ